MISEVDASLDRSIDDNSAYIDDEINLDSKESNSEIENEVESSIEDEMDDKSSDATDFTKSISPIIQRLYHKSQKR